MSKEKMKNILRLHYELHRPVTDDEIDAEVKNLERKRDKGTLDDSCEALAAKLGVI